MSLRQLRVPMFAAALAILGGPAALACTPPASYCQGGYLYICRCWTATGCSFEYAGTCLRDDPVDPRALLDQITAPPILRAETPRASSAMTAAATQENRAAH